MTPTVLARLLITEALKLRRTLALRMAFVAPCVVVMLYFLIGYVGAASFARTKDPWSQLTQNTVGMWTLLMMPLFLTLETSLLAGIEHADRNWKQLLALPVPRASVYLSKLLVTIALLLTAHAVLAVGTIASAALLHRLQPSISFGAMPLRALFVPVAKISAASLLALSIQHWVSLRWQSFAAAMGFGMCAMFIGFVAVNSPEWGSWYPWSLTMHATRTEHAFRLIGGALLGALCVTAFGCWEFSRREVAG
jgi:lantibiotic transport system permease protein